MEEPIKAVLLDIDEDELKEIAFEIGTPAKKIKEHFGQPCELTLACFVDEDDFDANYWDATFEDGFTLEALSGDYFERR